VHFAWKTELETGITALDRQHKEIYDCINNFFQKCSEDADADELDNLFNHLYDYTSKHFVYEENMQKYCKYPGIDEQQKQHALFLADIKELKSFVDINGSSREVTLRIKGNLIRWFNRHINMLDKEFVCFFNKKT
jgi:hemerythrin